MKISSRDTALETSPRCFTVVPRIIFWAMVLASVFSIILSRESFQRFDIREMTTLEELSLSSPVANPRNNQQQQQQQQDEPEVQEQVEEQQQPEQQEQNKQPDAKVSTLVSGIDWQGRNYTQRPVTAEESAFLTFQDTSGITAAVCHRTLHNKILLDPFFAFVSYYRLLGFDRIFIWYKPEIADLDRFDELQSLPYVTMAMYNGTAVKDGQEIVQDQCMQDTAYGRNYDWVLPIDVDEYLWFMRYESVKHFLTRYQALNKSYISIGKWMYTMKQGNDALVDSGFDFDRYPYTARAYCFQSPGKLNCPSWLGRCKILVKPSVHRSILIHGTTYLSAQPGGVHVNPNWAHLKEWSDLMRKQFKRHTKMRYDKKTLFVSKKSEVDTHKTMESHQKTKDGKVPFYFDSKLHPWLTFVAQGCPTNTTPAAIALEMSTMMQQDERGTMA